MSDIDPKAKIKKRASTPRSKTGCITCKMRRLKCGEEKPGCHRCVKSGWNCEGYNIPPGSSSSIPQASTESSLCTLAVAQFLDEEELRYFQIYAESTTTSLDICSDTTARFKRIMLQESHTNACLRHILVAQGAFSQSFRVKTDWAYLGQVNAPHNQHHEYALVQYNKALHELRSSFDTLQNHTGARATLISCIALSITDFFCGHGGAARHLEFGRKILASRQLCTGQSRLCPGWQEQQPIFEPVSPETLFQNHFSDTYLASPESRGRSPTSQPTSPVRSGYCGVNHLAREQEIDASLVQIFLTFDVQNLFASGFTSGCMYIDDFPIESIDISHPADISNLKTARQSRHALLYQGYHILVQNLKYHFVPKAQINQESIHTKERFLVEIQEWLDTVDPAFESYSTDPSTHPLTRPQALRYLVVILLIRMTGTLQAPQTVYDQLYPHFEYLLATAQEVIEWERTSTVMLTPGDRESFSFEARTTQALYLVATKCRIGTLRYRAVALMLDSRRREGVWDSLLSGKVAEWLIGLEEQCIGTTKILTGSVVPEDVRTWGEVIERDLQSREAVVSCRQNNREQPGTWKEMKTVINW